MHTKCSGWAGLLSGHGAAGAGVPRSERGVGDERPHGPREVGDDAPDGERVLPPELERDRVPLGHPPGPLLQRRSRRRGELRGHGGGGGPRDDARVRRPRPQVRQRGHDARLVDGRGCFRVRAARGRDGGASVGVRGGGAERAGEAHLRREHRRLGRAPLGFARLAEHSALRRSQKGGRLYAHAALLFELGAGVAAEHRERARASAADP
mmetsp:Transcript_59622/g.119696  ORF Transcript_59622/g.119696 Transcript_59622/m.119696 type:complete len:209 (+) Transcript_59622:849-1475(+)